MNFNLNLQTADPVHIQIEQFLRRQIQDGKLKARQRLPTTQELTRRWGVDCKALQKAMNRLVMDGLIERKPGRGTFVKETTGSLMVGLVFGHDLADETAYFYRAILKALCQELRKRGWRNRVYDRFMGPEEIQKPLPNEMRRQLLDDFQHYAFKGLIEIEPGAAGLGNLEDQIRLPRVRFSSYPRDTDLILDSRQFARDVMQFMAHNGRRKIIYLRPYRGGEDSADLAGLRVAARELGLPPPRVEAIRMKQQGAPTEQTIYQRMLTRIQYWQSQAGKSECPDAIISSDDIAMRAVALALIRCRVKVPAALIALTLTIEHLDLNYGIPVVLYEYSPGEIARQLVEILWQRMQKQRIPVLPVKIRGRFREKNCP